MGSKKEGLGFHLTPRMRLMFASGFKLAWRGEGRQRMPSHPLARFSSSPLLESPPQSPG